MCMLNLSCKLNDNFYILSTKFHRAKILPDLALILGSVLIIDVIVQTFICDETTI